MKDMTEAIDNLMSHMGTVLRYFAPGFAALLVVAAVIPDSRPFLTGGTQAVVVLGMLLGPTIYGIHTGAVVRGFWFLIVTLHKKARPLTVCRVMCSLDDQRWLRRASDNAQIKHIQREMDKWAAMLNFLYCVSLAMIVIPLVGRVSHRYPVSSEWSVVLLGGGLVLAATLISEYRITGKEIRLSEEYPNGDTKARTTACMVGSPAAGSPP